MKFEIKDLRWGGYWLHDNTDCVLIRVGDIWLLKENKKNDSSCDQSEDYFDYHGIEKALCGKEGVREPFTPKRILVIQMK